MAPRSGKVDPLQQERQLRRVQLHTPPWGNRQMKMADLEPLVPERIPATVPIEDLKAIRPPRGEDKEMTRPRLCVATHSRGYVSHCSMWRGSTTSLGFQATELVAAT
jgi:hypothetical protein